MSTTQKSGSGEVQEFDGKALDTPIQYSFTYNVYENLADAKSSEDWPSDNEVLKWINQNAERSAKSTAYQAATKTLRDAKLASPEYKLEQLIKQAMAMGLARDAAEAFARSTPIGQSIGS